MSLKAIGIVCADLKKTQEFYKVFGLKFKEVGGAEHLEADLGNGLRLMLDSENLISQINPLWKRSRNTGIVLCFEQSSPNKVDTVFTQAKEFGAKIEKDPWDAFWGQRYASVLDPDGNQIDIFAAL